MNTLTLIYWSGFFLTLLSCFIVTLTYPKTKVTAEEHPIIATFVLIVCSLLWVITWIVVVFMYPSTKRVA